MSIFKKPTPVPEKLPWENAWPILLRDYPVGRVFDYLGRTMIVTGFTYHRDSGLNIPGPALHVEYINDHGEIRSQLFNGSQLEWLAGGGKPVVGAPPAKPSSVKLYGKRLVFGLAEEFFHGVLHGVPEEATDVWLEFEAGKPAKAAVMSKVGTKSYELVPRKDGSIELGCLLAFTRLLKRLPVELMGFCPKGGRTVEIEPPPTNFA